MNIVYTQLYRAQSADRQKELYECMRRNLNHTGLNRVMLFLESDSPPLPTATVLVEVININERMTYAEWIRHVSRQGEGIGLVANAYIYMDEGLEHLGRCFDRLDVFLAVMHYNHVKVGLRLNGFTQCMKNVEVVSFNPEHPESLIYANSFPLGITDCNFFITHLLSNQGFLSCNPCYRVLNLQLQTSTAFAYDKTCRRYYVGVTYVDPRLAQDEAKAMQPTLGTNTLQKHSGVTIKSARGRIGSGAKPPWHRCSCMSTSMSRK